jgi:hypothetical protein
MQSEEGLVNLGDHVMVMVAFAGADRQGAHAGDIAQLILVRGIIGVIPVDYLGEYFE